MSFFKNLFGGDKKDNTFTPSADLMPEEEFWAIIETSRNNSDGDPEFQEDSLAAVLHKAPIEDLITFDNRYHQLRGQAYTWPLWGAAYIINGGCGDDSFCYFRDWLIVQGQEVYTQALADPGWLETLDLSEGETDAEGMAYVARKVFEERTGQELPAEFGENHNIIGTEWKEEGDDLARLFPALWEKYQRD